MRIKERRKIELDWVKDMYKILIEDIRFARKQAITIAYYSLLMFGASYAIIKIFVEFRQNSLGKEYYDIFTMFIYGAIFFIANISTYSIYKIYDEINLLRNNLDNLVSKYDIFKKIISDSRFINVKTIDFLLPSGFIVVTINIFVFLCFIMKIYNILDLANTFIIFCVYQFFLSVLERVYKAEEKFGLLSMGAWVFYIFSLMVLCWGQIENMFGFLIKRIGNAIH